MVSVNDIRNTISLPSMRSDANSRSGGAQASSSGSFAEAIKQGIENVNADIKAADKGIESYAMGTAKSMPEVIIALERADLSFKYMSTVRNKVLEAYNEVMRMTV